MMITENDVADCARTLLNNTLNIFLRDRLLDFINDFKNYDKDSDIYIVLKKICEDGYDVSDFGLDQIPHECVWMFSNKKRDKLFDVYLNHFNESEKYVAVGFVNSECSTEDADSIESAIAQYDIEKNLWEAFMDANEEVELTIFNNDTGTEKKYYIRSIFNIRQTDYIALTPIDDKDGLVELYRLSYDEGDNIILNDLESSEELEEVKEYFMLTIKQADTVISVMDDDGKVHLCEILQTFTYDSQDYIALLPLDAEAEEEKSINLFSYKVTETNGDLLNLHITEIPLHMYEGVASDRLGE